MSDRNYVIKWVSTATGDSGVTVLTATPAEFADHLLAFSDIAVVSNVETVDRVATNAPVAFAVASAEA